MKATPRLVVLDGEVVNPGDLSWREFEALGNCTVYPRTGPTEVIPRAREADVVLINKVTLGAETIRQLPALRYVGVLATGFNVVDLEVANARGIVVSNVPAYGTPSVAQHTFALLLELTQRVGNHAAGVRDGRWSRSLDWCYWDGNLVELAGLSLGIIGTGRIGRAVGALGQAFGMHVRFVSRTDGSDTLEDVIRSSDVVSLHCPLTPATHHLVNRRTLAWFKPTAILLNTSRGLLIDEPALADALARGAVAGAGLDVLADEPPSLANPLLSAPNCVITPHLAWASQGARQRLMRTAAANAAAFLRGAPQNVVNSPN